MIPHCCHQSVKDKNFESNSQLNIVKDGFKHVVISLSKIKIPKAQNQLNLCFRSCFHLSKARNRVFLCFRNQKHKCAKCDRNNYLCPSNYKPNDYEQNKDSDIGL